MASRQHFDEVAARVRNWGRWGPDDQLGTLNLITDETRRRASGLVRTGQALALGLPLSADEGIVPDYYAPGRVNPSRTMTELNTALSDDPDWILSSEDKVELSLQCATHWDGLAHVSYGGHIYNGFPASSVTEAGASLCGIHLVRSLVGRGVLLDVARAKKVDVLDPGYAITAEDLDAAVELAGVAVEPGDILLVRTGQMAHLRVDDPSRLPRSTKQRSSYAMPAPGLTLGTSEWFHAHDVAAAATDTLGFEVLPCEDPDLFLPVHLVNIVDMGLTQGQNWVLDELAEVCAADGRYEFFLDASPLPFTGALGSVLNPVVVR